MRKSFKRFFLAGCLIALSLFAVGCGNKGTKEHIKTGEERAIDAKKDAEEVVDQVNQRVEGINQDAQEIDEN